MNQPLEKKRNHLLTGCIVVSIALHAGFVAFLQTHSLWFCSPLAPHAQANTWAQALEKKARDQVLEETFEHSELALHATSAPKPQLEPEGLASLPAHIQTPEAPAPTHTLLPFPIDNLLASNTDLFQSRSFSLPPVETIDLFSDLPKDLILLPPPKSTPGASLLPQTEVSSIEQLTTQEMTLPVAPSLSIAFSEPLSNPAPLDPEESLGRALPKIGVPNLPRLPTLAELETTNLSNAFESELVFLPRDDGPGYIFALTLIPRSDLKLPKMRQHLTFLIDRSNSVQKDRLQSSKQAVHKALEELDTDDTFNIIVFDSKVEKLFSSLTPANTDSLAKAGTFLDQIQLGSFFSPADPYRPLLLTVPGYVRDDELYTAILITDGESLAKKPTQRSLLQHWTQQNNGRVALYTIAMGSDHHLATLDAASVFNKGRLVYATTNRGLRRKLLKLMKTIRTPVAKNMSIHAISRSPTGKIELYPKSTHSPHLFLDHPYVIIGVTETLDDFILFVQGKLKDQWLNIKKPISFLNAKRGGQMLKAEWALQKAYSQYEQYVIDDDPKHLAEARSILEPFDLQAAFE